MSDAPGLQKLFWLVPQKSHKSPYSGSSRRNICCRPGDVNLWVHACMVGANEARHAYNAGHTDAGAKVRRTKSSEGQGPLFVLLSISPLTERRADQFRVLPCSLQHSPCLLPGASGRKAIALFKRKLSSEFHSSRCHRPCLLFRHLHHAGKHSGSEGSKRKEAERKGSVSSVEVSAKDVMERTSVLRGSPGSRRRRALVVHTPPDRFSILSHTADFH